MKTLTLTLGGKALVLLHDDTLLPQIFSPEENAGTVERGLRIGSANADEWLLVESADRCIHLNGMRRRTYVAGEVFLLQGARVALLDPELGVQLLFAAEPGLRLARMRMGLLDWLRFSWSKRRPFEIKFTQWSLPLILLLSASGGFWFVRRDSLALAPALTPAEKTAASVRVGWMHEFAEWEQHAQEPEPGFIPLPPPPPVDLLPKHKQSSTPVLRGKNQTFNKLPVAHKSRCPNDILARRFLLGCSGKEGK